MLCKWKWPIPKTEGGWMSKMFPWCNIKCIQLVMTAILSDFLGQICSTWRSIIARGARNPNLQVVIMHASHVCSQHSFRLPLRMNGVHRMHFDQACLDLLSLIIWSRVFWPSVTWNLHKAQRWSKSVWTFDHCCPLSLTFGYY